MADSIANCPNCGRKRDPEHRYCPGCGQSLLDESGGIEKPANSVAMEFRWGRAAFGSFAMLGVILGTLLAIQIRSNYYRYVPNGSGGRFDAIGAINLFLHSPTPTPTDTPTSTPTPAATSTPTSTATPTSTPTPNPTLVAAMVSAATEVAKPAFLTQSFAVKARSYYKFSLPLLDAGTTIELQFSVVGGNNDIGFGIQGPTGQYVSGAGRAHGSQNVSYVVKQTGTYRLIFDNTFSIFTSKAVTLNYRVYR